jgi:hypothetical protein
MTSRLIGLFVSAVAITVLAKPATGQALPDVFLTMIRFLVRFRL